MQIGKKLLALLLIGLVALSLVACDKDSDPFVTITFDPNGGTLTSDAHIDIHRGAAIGTLPAATRLGYILDGWTSERDGGTRITAATTFSENATIYASWEETDLLVVTFDLHGGAMETPISVPVNVEDFLTPFADPTRPDHIFEGWLDVSGAIPVAFDFATMPVLNDMTLHAAWNFDRSLAVDDTELRTNLGNPALLNPIDSLEADVSNVTDFLRSPFFIETLNWPGAIAAGKAQREFDFSRVGTTPGFLQLDDIGTTRIAGLASSLRAVTADSDFLGADGVLDVQASRNTLDTVWELTLAPGNNFYDTTGAIRGSVNADVFIYTVQIYASPTLINQRQTHVTENMGIVGSAAYAAGTGTWADVEIEKVDEYTVRFTGDRGQNHWTMMGWINLLFLVHPDQFEPSLNADRTVSHFGNADFLPWSTGAFRLTNWEPLVEFRFVRIPTNVQVQMGVIPFASIHATVVIGAGAPTVLEGLFATNQLDSLGLDTERFRTYRNHPGLRQAPVASHTRYVINNTPRPEGGRQTSVLLGDARVRTAIYLATNRHHFANNVRYPNLPAQGLVSDLHRPSLMVTEQAAYNTTPQRREVMLSLGLAPDTYGYDPDRARELFDAAFADAVTAGTIPATYVMDVELTVFNSPDNMTEANWLRDTWMAILGDRFTLTIRTTETTAQFWGWLDAADFDLFRVGVTGGHGIGIQGIWNQNQLSANGWGIWGYDFSDFPVSVPLTNALEFVLATPIDDRTPAMERFLDSVDDQGVFTGTASELWILFFASYAGIVTPGANPDGLPGAGELFSTAYDGLGIDLNEIMAAFEHVVLSDMPQIPLMTAVESIVFNERNVLLFPMTQFSLGWGGFRYRLVTGPLVAT